MCGRFAIYSNTKVIIQQTPFDVQNMILDVKPNYNAAPSQFLPVLYSLDKGPPLLDSLKWGLIPHWAKDPKIGYKMINARSETVSEKPSFRQAFVKRRALVPVDGWYEWLRKGDSKLPFYHTTKDGRLLWLAGLWERWTDKTSGESIRSFSLLTQDSYGDIAGIHNRMPVIMHLDDLGLSALHEQIEDTQTRT